MSTWEKIGQEWHRGPCIVFLNYAVKYSASFDGAYITDERGELRQWAHDIAARAHCDRLIDAHAALAVLRKRQQQ